jgi:3-methyladenine DNA glycosylase AlkD
MPARKKPARATVTEDRRTSVEDVLASLQRQATKATLDGMARYGIHAEKAFGVSMAAMKQLAKGIGKDHPLALALWETGWYEARLVAALVGDPQRMTAAEMERWSRGFDNWGVVDTACFFLFDQTPHAWKKVDQWSRRKDEFVRRAGFALLASLALHDKQSNDAVFRRQLELIEAFAHDERNFVKKGVSWALHAIGTRTIELNRDAVSVARRLSASDDSAERWVGKDALRKLNAAATRKRFQKTRRSTR